MQAFVPAEKVSSHNVFFVDKKKNVIIDGNFIKILYSNEYMELNGLCISFKPFIPTNTPHTDSSARRGIMVTPNTKSTNAKYLIEFHPYHFENSAIINRLCYLERAIVEQYVSTHAPNKTAVFNLRNQLMAGSIKIQSANEPNVSALSPANYALKISGVWETNTSVGITVKFITVVY